MPSTLGDMREDLVSYTTYDSDDFLAMRDTFIQASEERCWFFVQLPFFRRAVTGTFVSGNQYLELPTDFLAAASLAITVSSEYRFLLNKDVSYIREVYPNPSTTGVPFCYALFDNSTIIIGPTPAASYPTELDYFYRPASLTTVGEDGTTWLSEHAYNTLLYGALAEAQSWLKREKGIDGMATAYEERFQVGLVGLKNLGEARDRKDTYRSGEKRMPE